MAQDLHQATELVFAKLPREWSFAALGAGDRWTVSAPDGSRLAGISEPLLKNPVRRAVQAMSPTYPVADRFHFLEFQDGHDVPLFVLEKLPVGRRRSGVWLPEGDELGTVSFSRSEVEAKKTCLSVRDATGAALAEVLRVKSPDFPSGFVNYAVHGATGGRIASLDGVPLAVDHWRGSYRMSLTAALSEPLHTLVLAAALACPYMRL